MEHPTMLLNVHSVLLVATLAWTIFIIINGKKIGPGFLT